MGLMPDSLHFDLGELRRIAAGVLAVAADLSAHSRALRVSLCPPATDVVSLELCRRANRERLALGLLGDGAADELVRLVETFVGGAYDMATIARRTQLAIMGLDVPAMAGGTEVSPPLPARSGADGGCAEMPAVEPDDQVLSFAVLLSEGSDTLLHEPVEVERLRSVGARLRPLADELRAAISYGDRPGRALELFGEWIAGDYAGAVADLDERVAVWAAEYARCREMAFASSRSYVAWLAAALSGREVPAVPTESARAILAGYSAVSVQVPRPAGFPRLG